MRELINTLLDWIYPPRCMSCRNPLPLQDKRGRRLWLCTYCENLFQPLDKPGCTICSTPVKEGVARCSSCSSRTLHFTNNHSGYAYEGLVRDLMHEIKFRRKRHVAQGLGRLWAGMVAENIIDDALIVPLPMHPKKRRERGFDQAEIMAQAIADATGKSISNILERIKDTPPQSGLHPKLRVDNVKDAFRVRPGSSITAKSVILVDDIYTTGASLSECARVLKSHGVANVYAMTLAIAIKKSSDNSSENLDLPLMFYC